MIHCYYLKLKEVKSALGKLPLLIFEHVFSALFFSTEVRTFNAGLSTYMEHRLTRLLHQVVDFNAFFPPLGPF